jgi:hypothetical protein
MQRGLRGSAFVALATALLAGCATPLPAYVPQGIVVPLKNAGIEDDWPAGYPCVPGWICLMHSDATAYRFAPDEAKPAKGKRSACVTRVRDEPWVSTIQANFDRALLGKRLRFSLDVRLQGVTGKGAGAWVALKDARGVLLHQVEKLAGGTRDWQRLAVEFTVAPETAEMHVGTVLLGPGEICFDDAVLEILQESKSPV